MEYLPFGGYRVRQDLDGPFPNANYTFTDQEDDDETGLYNYKARLYDPLLGRFISADSIVPEPGNLQAFNRYSYCVNNPLVYVDPSGHGNFFDDIGDLFSDVGDALSDPKVLAGIAVMAVCFYAAGAIIAGIESAAAASATAATGELAMAQMTAFSMAQIHAAAGAVSGGINAAICGTDIGKGALIGGISGGLAKYAGAGLFGGSSPVLANTPLNELGVRMGVGAITSGIASGIYGGNIGQGMGQGAVVAGMGCVFNDWFDDTVLPWMKKMWTRYIKPNYADTSLGYSFSGAAVSGGILRTRDAYYKYVCAGAASIGPIASHMWGSVNLSEGLFVAYQFGAGGAGGQIGYSFGGFAPGDKGGFFGEGGATTPGASLLLCRVWGPYRY